MNEKTQLRQSLRSKLNAISASERITASADICQTLSQAPQLSGIEYIAIYSAQRNEINLSALHQLLPEKKLLYPLCHSDNQLTFHHVLEPTDLTSGKHKILEPDPTQHSEIPIDTIALFLCPGVAFSVNGTRLGQGGGYYDRALERRSSHSLMMGIGLEMQILDHIPSEEHDIRMDYLLTEAGLRAAI